MSILKSSDYKVYSGFIENLAKKLTRHFYSKLNKKFKTSNKLKGKGYDPVTSGGTKLNSSEDFLTPWLKVSLNFFGIEKVEVVSADQMALDYEKSIKDAEAQIEKISRS